MTCLKPGDEIALTFCDYIGGSEELEIRKFAFTELKVPVVYSVYGPDDADVANNLESNEDFAA